MKKRSPEEAAALIAAYETAPEPKRGQPEYQIQIGIMKALRAAGFAVYSTSQGFRAAPGGTRMTPGIPDLYAVDGRANRVLWVEVKTERGRLTPQQEVFAAQHCWGGMPEVHCWRSLEDCRQYLLSIGRAHA